MDKERSEWVKKYRLDHGVSDQAARKAYLKHNQNTTEIVKTQPKMTAKQRVMNHNYPILAKTQPKSTTVCEHTGVTCPTCKGSGKVPITSKPKERELTELPRLLPRRL